MTALWRMATSVRTAAVLLAALAVLLLLNVVIPQRAVVGEAAFAALLEAGSVQRFLLGDLGLGSLATSPPFVLVLTLVVLNLGCVLADRGGVTLRRVRFRPPSVETLRQRAQGDDSLSRPLPEGWSAEAALDALKGLGYRRTRVGAEAVWGVRHRLAPLGFVLFHLSFLLLLAGGVLLHLTRFVAVATVAEGQTFTGEGATVLRRPLWGAAPGLEMTVERVEVDLERGEPVHLGAVLRFPVSGERSLQEAWINHPARVGTTTVLVERAGLAPVLWLQDERGFSLDRVVAPAPPAGEPPLEVPLAGGRLIVEIAPRPSPEAWPSREQVAATPIALRVLDEGRVLFDGGLRAGQGTLLDGDWLAVPEIRQWVGVRIVSERGSALLVAGFGLGVIGLVWRLSWHRREMAILWDTQRLTLTGRSELFHRRFREELQAVAELVAPGEWHRSPGAGPDDPTG